MDSSQVKVLSCGYCVYAALCLPGALVVLTHDGSGAVQVEVESMAHIPEKLVDLKFP